jgi:archaeosine synthase
MSNTLQEAEYSGVTMAEGLGRTVLHRSRFARIWGLGNRSAPVAQTPCLISASNDPEELLRIAPFRSSQTRTIPAKLTIDTVHCLTPPNFDVPGPVFEASIGHVLPPSLDEANAGESADSGSVLPLSWQRLHHDPSLLVEDLKPHIVVLVDAVQLAAQSGKLVQAINVIKNKFPGALLWTPGLGGPDNAAVLAWFGVDIFDFSRAGFAVASGHLLTAFGPRAPLDGEECSSSVAVTHYDQSLRSVRSAIASGTLRTLAEQQSLNSPKLVEHMRFFDKLVNESNNVMRIHPLGVDRIDYLSTTSHQDSSVGQWVDFISNQYQVPEKLDNVLVLLPCSARKPYRLSKSHRKFIQALGTNACHEVMVTSPLGLVPRDLEDVWPAAFYDIPVTGDWSRDELHRINSMVRNLVVRHNYECIINHSGMDLEIEGFDIIDTRQGESSGSRNALQRLTDAVQTAKEELRIHRRKGERVNLDRFMSISRYLHKSDEWLNDCKVRGKPPRWKIERDGKQIALWSFERAGFSFSKEAVKYLDSCSALPRVHLVDDVKWKGDLHYGIVKSFESGIRMGQDLIVMQNDVAIGLARSIAPGWEWSGTPGRLAKMHQRI